MGDRILNNVSSQIELAKAISSLGFCFGFRIENERRFSCNAVAPTF
jgi:hypothetical protein